MNATSLEILEKTQLPPNQARAILQVMELELAARESPLATKSEVREALHSLELSIERMRTDIKGFESRMAGMERRIGGMEDKIGGIEDKIGGIEGKIGSIEGKIAAVEGRLMRWVLTCIMGQTAVIAGAVYFGLTHLRR